MSKILTPGETQHIADKDEVVLCQGCFDVLHIGHIEHLRAAKKYGKVLVVAVTEDMHVNKGPDRPIFTLKQRMGMLAALSMVDFVVPSVGKAATASIHTIQPAYYVKGNEYRDKPDPTGKIDEERIAVEVYGGKLVFTDEPTYSSSAIIAKNTQDLLARYVDQRNITKEYIESTLERCLETAVLVVGEGIHDVYTPSVTSGIPNKKHGILSYNLSKDTQEIHYGGAYATARHMAALSDHITVITTGDMPNHNKIERVINIPGMSITKERITVDGTPKVKMDRIHIEDTVCTALYNAIHCLPHHNILVNDFGHGLIDTSVATIVQKAKFLAVNAQGNSANNYTNTIAKYDDISYLSLNKKELDALLPHTTSAPLHTLLATMPVRTVACTLGNDGAQTLCSNGIITTPAYNVSVIDETGAGDAFFGVSALALMSNVGADIANLFGIVAGALACTIKGNQHGIDTQTFRRAVLSLV